MANKRVSFRKRWFLNPASADEPSYINAVVESSRDGENRWGTNVITIADCRRKVDLEFFLGTAASRRWALIKINLIIANLTRFRDALAKEIELIENYKRTR